MGSDFRARRGLRALAVTTTHEHGTDRRRPPSPRGAATTTNIQRAQQGAQWLANQIKHNGGLLQNFGKPDPVDTAYAVIGMRAAGVDKAASDQAIAALKTQLGTDARDRRSRLARRARRVHPGGARRRAGPAALRRQRRPQQSRPAAARDRTHERSRRRPLRRGGARRSTARSAKASRSPPSRSKASQNDPRVDRRHRVADEAAVRERALGGLPRQAGQRPVPARQPEDVHRSRHEQHRGRGDGPRCVGQPRAQSAVLSSLAGDPVERRRIPVRRGAGPVVGSRTRPRS